jgi:tetratricopeptide (TPR) repeat protein
MEIMKTKSLILLPIFLIAIGLFFVFGCGQGKDDITDLTEKGRTALDEGEFIKAVNIFREALNQKPSDRDLLFLMGTAYKKLDMFDSALVYFNRGKILYDNDREFNEELVELCPMFGDFGGAINAIAKLVLLGDNEQMYWYRLAELYYYDRQLTMAVKYYQLLIDENPQRASIYLKLAHTLSELKKYDEAIKVLHQCLDSIGPTPEAWANLGLNHMSLNQLDDAEAAFRSSLALDSDNTLIWINLANLLSSRNSKENKKEALSIYRRYQEQVPPAYKVDSLIAALEAELGE